jgi:ribosomal protein S27AE
MALKKCFNPDCLQEIDDKETECPKCGVVFADLEEEVKVVSRAQRIADERKKAVPPPTVQPPATQPAKRKSLFASLARKKG